MPRAVSAATQILHSLSRRELGPFLDSLYHDTASPPEVGLQAFTATAMGLYRHFDRDEVDAALCAIDPSHKIRL